MGKGRKTPTNPDGLPMKKVPVSFPVDVIFKVKQIAKQTLLPEQAIYRKALQEYIFRHYMKEDSSDTAADNG